LNEGNINSGMGLKVEAWNAHRRHNETSSLYVPGKERCQPYARKFTMKMTKVNR
jgi:hypothetical protein